MLILWWVCECKSGWGGLMVSSDRTFKVWTFIAWCVGAVLRSIIGQNIWKLAGGDIVCWKCRGHKGLEMFRGENAKCNWEKWAGNHPEKIKELWQSYHVENRGKVYNQIEVDCEVCAWKVRENKWARHLKTKTYGRSCGGGVMDKLYLRLYVYTYLICI